MIERKWSLKTAAAWGGALGPVLLLLRKFALGEPFPVQFAELIGLAIGAAVGGVLLFVIAAAIRNLFVPRG